MLIASLQNNLAELRNLMDFCCEGLLGSARSFARFVRPAATASVLLAAQPPGSVAFGTLAITGPKALSQLFTVCTPHQTLLRLKNRYQGMCKSVFWGTQCAC